MRYRLADITRGLVIYPLGDSVAALLMHEFSVQRLLGMVVVGGLIYSLEIPAWFSYINGKYSGVQRTLMAMLYFNPLWIARHLLFIFLFSGQISMVHWSILTIALKSFAVNLPVAFAANYIIQNKLPLNWRFFSSAVFSSLMAIYYALSRVIFK
ncbi:MAG: hypothetical protein U9P42_02745 [Candidatus Fermentibacteria bacterium]|nr:hypothetical protein [Candidatus Fermentibacteria bacterium]